MTGALSAALIALGIFMVVFIWVARMLYPLVRDYSVLLFFLSVIATIYGVVFTLLCLYLRTGG